MEQQLVQSILIPRDNLYLGPGSYDPQLFERNISSPVIKRTTTEYHPHKSKKKTHTHKSLGYNIVNDINGSMSYQSRQENVTIFHEHDRREPIDPSRRYFVAQYPELPQQPIIDPLCIDGRRKTPGVLFDRQPQRPATGALNPDANPNFNTDVVMPRLKMGYIPKTERPDIFPAAPDYSIPDNKRCQRPMTNQTNCSSSPVSPSKKSVYDAFPGHAPHPRKEYDSSCYNYKSTSSPQTLHPALINSMAKVHIFNKSLLERKKVYDSRAVGSAVADRVKKNSFK